MQYAVIYIYNYMYILYILSICIVYLHCFRLNGLLVQYMHVTCACKL